MGDPLQSVDLNLLIVFATLMKEKSVTRCATRLNVGQSTISSSLGRLRALFNDPLFIRVARGVQPTDKAMSIAQLVGPALDLIWDALRSDATFVPERCDREFSLAVGSGVHLSWVLALVKSLRKIAPGISISVERVDSNSVSNRTALGRATIGVGYFSDDLKGLEGRVLRSCRSVLVRARDTEAVDCIEAFCDRPHAVIPLGNGVAYDLDKVISQYDLRRRIALRLPNADAIENMIADSDIVTVMPDFEAHGLQHFSDLVVDALPDELESRFDLRMIWPQSKAVSAADLWFREKVASLITRSRS